MLYKELSLMAMPGSRPRNTVSCEGHLQDVDPVGSENRAWRAGEGDNMQGTLKHDLFIFHGILINTTQNTETWFSHIQPYLFGLSEKTFLF